MVTPLEPNRIHTLPGKLAPTRVDQDRDADTRSANPISPPLQLTNIHDCLASSTAGIHLPSGTR